MNTYLIPSNVYPVVKRAPTSEDIRALQEFLATFPQVELEARHHHSKGQYVREMRIPKGFYVVGKEHKTRHLNILTTGKMTVWTVHGRLDLCAEKGPVIYESVAGVKKVGYAHEDSVWLTVHPTDEVDQDRLEFQFIKAEEQELLFPEVETLYLGGKNS
jgi:hypothetical protein